MTKSEAQTRSELIDKLPAHERGLSFATMNRWENDRAKPSPPLALEKIESLLRSLGGKALHKTYFGKDA